MHSFISQYGPFTCVYPSIYFGFMYLVSRIVHSSFGLSRTSFDVYIMRNIMNVFYQNTCNSFIYFLFLLRPYAVLSISRQYFILNKHGIQAKLLLGTENYNDVQLLLTEDFIIEQHEN